MQAAAAAEVGYLTRPVVLVDLVAAVQVVDVVAVLLEQQEVQIQVVVVDPVLQLLVLQLRLVVPVDPE